MPNTPTIRTTRHSIETDIPTIKPKNKKTTYYLAELSVIQQPYGTWNLQTEKLACKNQLSQYFLSFKMIENLSLLLACVII